MTFFSGSPADAAKASASVAKSVWIGRMVIFRLMVFGSRPTNDAQCNGA
jgi:hypothetical protein